MKNIHVYLMCLISALFISSGIMAQQNDAAPGLNDQLKLEKQIKAEKALKLEQSAASKDAPEAAKTYKEALQERMVVDAIEFGNEVDPNAKPSNITFNSDDLFDLQFSWPAGVGGGEAGLETDGNYVYTTKWNGAGEFYRYGMDGTYIEVFTISGATGIRDLAYNGTYFYGAPASTSVKELDLANETLISSFTAPTAVRAIGYNEDDDVFYGNNWSTDITVFDMAGANLGSWATGPAGASYYGFAYDNYCGGQFLWGYCQPGTTPATQNVIIQMALPSGAETGVSFDVATVVTPVTGIAGGLCVTDQVVSGYWTIMGNMQNEFIWGLELCTSGPAPTNDVGIQQIIEPVTGVNLTSSESVTVKVRNYGTDPQSNFDVWFTLDGGTPVVETITTTLNGGESIDHTFGTTVDLSAFGTYAFEACTDLTGDENASNDCKTANVENLEPSLCAPVYSSGCVVGDGFTDFAVEQIQNLNNGCDDNQATGWSQYFGLGPAMLLPGNTYTFTMGTGYSNQFVNIWIDFNDDLVLTPDEMIIQDYNMAAAGTLYDVDITIPANAATGEHVMRAMAVWNGTFSDPCGSYSYGEAEDYKVMLGVPDYGSLEGFVTENTGGAAIAGAMVSVNNGQWTTTTAADGFYEFDNNILVGTYDVDVTADGYNPAMASVVISSGATTTQDFALTAPSMVVSPLTVSMTLDPNTMGQDFVDITNNGDGDLGWDATVELIDDNAGSKDAWDLQFQFDVEAASGALGNAGAECDGQYYYTTRWASNLIHKYDLTGTLIEEFSIPGVTGLRDLAFDGTYMYGGAAAGTIYEMDFVAQTLVSSISNSGQARSIAYDADNDAFWISNFGSDVWLIDKTGATVNTIPNANLGLAGMYGSAYDNTSGTPYLWIFDQGAGAGTAQLIHQVDLTTLLPTGFTYDVMTDLGPNAGAIAGGLFMVDNVYPGVWSIGGLLQGTPDVFFMYEFAPAGPVWLTISPNSGTVAPGNTDVMTLDFDATGLTAGEIYNANIHVMSDPDVGMETVEVELIVGNLQVGHITGNVMLDGAATYNIGDVTEVLVEAGAYSDYPDASGNYDITAYPGTYDVTATLYGYQMQTSAGVVVPEGVTVDNIDFVMPTLYGRIMGTVTDADNGTPIENAMVSVVGTDFEAMTAVDGTYEIFIEAGTYDIMADHPTYMAETMTGVAVVAENDVTVDFDLTYQCDFCAADGGADEYIDGVEIGTISNLGTGYVAPGYSNYTNLSTLVLPGMTYTLTVHTGNFYTSDDYGVWIDWNQDCTFDPATENVVCGIDMGAATNTWDITVPPTAFEGNATMRVRLKWSGSDCGDPCGSTTYGEVEDYTLVIAPGEYGELEGTVTELATGNPIQNAEIDVANGLYTTTTDNTGYYYFDEVFVGTWDVTCTADGYNPEMETVLIEENVLTVQDFALAAPQIVVDPLTIDITMDPNATQNEIVNISNPGNGTVDWSAAVVLDSDNGTDDLFDLQFSWPAGVGGGEAGLETDGNYVYTTKWNGAGEFYRYGMDGTYIEVFTISGAAAVRDLAYNGTYFYGGPASTTVFELDLANEALVSQFTAPTAVRAIAYNEDDDVFYGNNWSTDITMFDMAGANLGSWATGPAGASYYGFAYDNYSSGAPYLWGYCQPGASPATQNVLIQMELPSGAETGVSFDVATVVTPVTGIAGGLCISDAFVPGFYTIAGNMQNEFLWGVELCPAGPVWLTIDNNGGTLTGGSDEDITAMFNTFDMLPGIYTAEIQFSTSPDVGSPVVDVTLTVDGLIPAINLTMDYLCTDVMLEWDMPTGGNPDSWNVYRDDVLIGNTTTMDHTDAMVDPMVEYGYYVKAVYDGEESGPTATEYMTVPEPDDMEVTDLNGDANGPVAELVWSMPDCCVEPDGYNVFRDGTQINTSLVTETEYDDNVGTPGFYEYYVTAVYYWGESGNSAPAYVLIEGVNELLASQFEMFPNPASEFINVRSDFNVTSYEVLNNAGQMVMSSEVNASSFKIDVASYESGIYYIKLTTEEGVALRKVAID